MLKVDYGIIAAGKKEYNNGKYPTKYYCYTKYGTLINVSRETYDRYESECELVVHIIDGKIYIKEKEQKGE